MIETTIRTAITARVGFSGTKTHRVDVEISDRFGKGEIRAAVFRTHCGSQRLGSGMAVLPLGTVVTCEKCRDRGAAQVDYDRHHEAATYADGSSSPERRTIGVADYTKVVRMNGRTIVPTDEAIATIEADRSK